MTAFFKLIVASALMAVGSIGIIVSLETAVLAGSGGGFCEDDGCAGRSNVNSRDCAPANQSNGCSATGDAKCKCDEDPESTSKCYCKRTS